MAELVSPRDFERRVAGLYRVLGADVQHDAVLAGSQFDVVVEERTASGSRIIRVVECKAYTGPVGVSVIRSFAGLVDLLRSRGLADVATVVSLNGFTNQARQAAEATHIELLEVADLEARIPPGDSTPALEAQIVAAEALVPEVHDTSPRGFVVMPFGADLEDLYVLGIRDVAEKLGAVVERADEIEHNESIIETIRAKIRSSQFIIAEVTAQNPNVMYEVGYAHGVETPVVMLSRSDTTMPFDVAGYNHVRYSSILDLQRGLEKRLQQVITTLRPTGPASAD